MFRIADAEESLGESEVREAHLAKSLFFIRIGDKVDKFVTHWCWSSICLFMFTLSVISYSLVYTGKRIGTAQID